MCKRWGRGSLLAPPQPYSCMLLYGGARSSTSGRVLLQKQDGSSTDCLHTLCLQGAMVPHQCRTSAWAPTLRMGMAPRWACQRALGPLQHCTGSHRAQPLGLACNRHRAMTVWLEIRTSPKPISHMLHQEDSTAVGSAPPEAAAVHLLHFCMCADVYLSISFCHQWFQDRVSLC